LLLWFGSRGLANLRQFLFGAGRDWSVVILRVWLAAHLHVEMLPDRRLFANDAGLPKFAHRFIHHPNKLKGEYVSFMCRHAAQRACRCRPLTMNSVAREKFRS
jgi:hypothetical protein